MDLSSLGKVLVTIGLILAAMGGLVWLIGRTGLPLGRLPGDINIRRPGFALYFPLTTMLLVSLLLTVALNIILRLFRR